MLCSKNTFFTVSLKITVESMVSTTILEKNAVLNMGYLMFVQMNLENATHVRCSKSLVFTVSLKITVKSMVSTTILMKNAVLNTECLMFVKMNLINATHVTIGHQPRCSNLEYMDVLAHFLDFAIG